MGRYHPTVVRCICIAFAIRRVGIERCAHNNCRTIGGVVVAIVYPIRVLAGATPIRAYSRMD